MIDFKSRLQISWFEILPDTVNHNVRNFHSVSNDWQIIPAVKFRDARQLSAMNPLWIRTPRRPVSILLTCSFGGNERLWGYYLGSGARPSAGSRGRVPGQGEAFRCTSTRLSPYTKSSCETNYKWDEHKIETQ